MHRMTTSLIRLPDQGNIGNNDQGKENKGKQNNASYYRAENLASKECLTLEPVKAHCKSSS